MPSMVSSMGRMWTLLPLGMSGHGCTATTSPNLTLRFLPTTLFILILMFSRSSPSSVARAIQTVSLLFLPIAKWWAHVACKCWLITFDQDGISLEDFELVHLGLGHFNDWVVIVLCLLNSELVWGLLSLKNSLWNVFLFAIEIRLVEGGILLNWNLFLEFINYKLYQSNFAKWMKYSRF